MARIMRLREELSRIEPDCAQLATWPSHEAQPPVPLAEIDAALWATHFERLREREKTNRYRVVLPVANVRQSASLILIEGTVSDPELLRAGEHPDTRRFPTNCVIETSIDGDIFSNNDTLSRALEALITVREPECAAVHVNWPPGQQRYWLFWTSEGFDEGLQSAVHIDAAPDQTKPNQVWAARSG